MSPTSYLAALPRVNNRRPSLATTPGRVNGIVTSRDAVCPVPRGRNPEAPSWNPGALCMHFVNATHADFVGTFPHASGDSRGPSRPLTARHTHSRPYNAADVERRRPADPPAQPRAGRRPG